MILSNRYIKHTTTDAAHVRPVLMVIEHIDVLMFDHATQFPSSPGEDPGFP